MWGKLGEISACMSTGYHGHKSTIKTSLSLRHQRLYLTSCRVWDELHAVGKKNLSKCFDKDFHIPFLSSKKLCAKKQVMQ